VTARFTGSGLLMGEVTLDRS